MPYSATPNAIKSFLFVFDVLGFLKNMIVGLSSIDPVSLVFSLHVLVCSLPTFSGE